MLPECIPQTGQMLPNYPDRRLRRIRIINSLMDMFYVHPSNIVRTVAALEKQGMIMRSPNDKDKRTCKLYPTERALSVIDEVQTVCEKTEALLLQGFRESDKNLFIDLLIQAGENITAELRIERKGDEFND